MDSLNSVKVYGLKQLSCNSNKRKSIEDFVENFRAKFDCQPNYVICSPGRVNLIGDHVDYHDFPVFPMAIEKSILVGVSIEQTEANVANGITLKNMNDKTYPDWNGAHSFEYAAKLSKSNQWFHYFLCAYHGVLAKELLGINLDNLIEHSHLLEEKESLLEESNKRLADLANIKLLVDSSLPAASGLSSSSALVCASSIVALILLHHSRGEEGNLIISNNELAQDCSKFERLVGVNGGGMDQAVIMTAQEGFAKFVNFKPNLICQNIKLPDGISWLVSYSGHKYPKAATSGYNMRVLETKLGAALIVKHAGAEEVIKLDKTITLERVKTILFDDMEVRHVIDYLTNEVFHERDEFSIKEICEVLDLTRSQLVQQFNTSEEFLNNECVNKLQLLKRCIHVYEEMERVELFKRMCDEEDVDALGKLMTASHYSLRDKYECSHEALDCIVNEALEGGALGSRLTGAGWGGCTVTLVKSDQCHAISDRLSKISEFTFETKPQAGCCIIKLT